MKAGAADADPVKRSPGWFDHPVLSLLIGGVWLLLQQSIDFAPLLIAGLLAVLLPRLLHGFLGPLTSVRAPASVLLLAARVLWDIVVSNLVVARIVLNPAAAPQPAWVPVPLDLRHPTAITVLASIITTTPGTVSCVVDEERHRILVHALDCADAAALAAEIKQRYEKPLMEIFG